MLVRFSVLEKGYIFEIVSQSVAVDEIRIISNIKLLLGFDEIIVLGSENVAVGKRRFTGRRRRRATTSWELEDCYQRKLAGWMWFQTDERKDEALDQTAQVGCHQKQRGQLRLRQRARQRGHGRWK